MLQKPYDQIIRELEESLSLFDLNEIEKLAELILNTEKIFVTGAGRSGLMMRCFAMRLMHMGLKTYVIGETTTPCISERDLLLIGSGSGETGSLVVYAEIAKRNRAAIGLVTIFSDSSIGKLADQVVLIPAKTCKKESSRGIHSAQPLGNLFEQSLLLLLDGLTQILMEKTNLNSAEKYKNHANLE
jgi:6-phospho-3-hexuloisomerase